MTIDPARLAVETIKRDGQNTTVTPPPVCIKIFVLDPRVFSFSREEITDTSMSTKPSIESEICGYRPDSSKPEIYLLMAAKDQYGVLVWHPKTINLTSFFLDPRTGRAFDPNADFYNPLAS